MHSEEHLVLETPRASEFKIGDVLYGVPWHICPTVALHSYANVVRDGRVVEKWKVAGRERVLTV
jgi:D-serine deaminase-like pyridoxal phosphate-dependent protein